MTTVAIELNDAEIRVVDASGVVAQEPGYALVEGNDIVVGHEAYRQASLKPRHIHNHFWSELSTQALPRTESRPLNHADLAYSQLSKLWADLGGGARDALFVVPSSFEREQLALLLGIAKACEIPVRGLVDASVASTTRAHHGATLHHWDLGLHAAVLSELSQEGGVERIGGEILPRRGLAALREGWIGGIVRAFVDQSRFDPSHDAEGEQALLDGLDEFVATVMERDRARLELQQNGVAHRAEIRRADLLRSSREVLGALIERLVVGGREGGEQGSAPVVVQASHRLADLPGFREALERAGDVTLVALEPDAACLGALARLDQIPVGGEGHRLVRRLDWVPDGT
jgi:hypothetical protein